jgi:hypothetical protein
MGKGRCRVCGTRIGRSDGAYANVGLCREHGEMITFRQPALTMLRDDPERARQIIDHGPYGPDTPMVEGIRKQLLMIFELLDHGSYDPDSRLSRFVRRPSGFARSKGASRREVGDRACARHGARRRNDPEIAPTKGAPHRAEDPGAARSLITWRSDTH